MIEIVVRKHVRKRHRKRHRKRMLVRRADGSRPETERFRSMEDTAFTELFELVLVVKFKLEVRHMQDALSMALSLYTIQDLGMASWHRMVSVHVVPTRTSIELGGLRRIRRRRSHK